jgi:hypothetical protein
VLVVLFVVTQKSRANRRDRLRHTDERRHWWNRTRNGH